MNLDEMTTMTHEMVGRIEALEESKSNFEEQIDALEKAVVESWPVTLRTMEALGDAMERTSKEVARNTKAAETNAAAIDAFAAMILEDDVLLGIARLLIASTPGGVQITPALQLVAETEERDAERRSAFRRGAGVAP